jgi:hypothetical protein
MFNTLISVSKDYKEFDGMVLCKITAINGSLKKHLPQELIDMIYEYLHITDYDIPRFVFSISMSHENIFKDIVKDLRRPLEERIKISREIHDEGKHKLITFVTNKLKDDLREMEVGSYEEKNLHKLLRGCMYVYYKY